MEDKVIIGLKLNFSVHGLMVRMNLSLHNVRNCQETTTFAKEFEKYIKYKKKGILNFAYKYGLLFEKFEEPDDLKGMYKEKGVSKPCKSVRKVSKTQSGNECK